MAVIGSLVVDLLLKSATFNAELAKASNAVAKETAAMGKTLSALQTKVAIAGKAFKGLTAGFSAAVVVHELVDMTKHSFELTDTILDMSKAVGLSTTDFQALSAEAVATGGSMEMAVQGTTFFTKSLGELRAGQGKLFDALKTTNPELIKQLTTASNADALVTYARYLKGIGNSADFARMRNAAFGRTSAELGDVIDGLADGFTNLKAKYSGVIITPEQLQNIDKAREAWALLGMAIQVGFAKGLGDILPTTQDASSAMNVLSTITETLAGWVTKFVAVDVPGMLRFIKTTAHDAAGGWGEMYTDANKFLEKSIPGLKSVDDWILKQLANLKDLVTKWNDLGDSQDRGMKNLSFGGMREGLGMPAQPEGGPDPAEAKKAADALAAAHEKLLKSFGLLDSPMEKYNATLAEIGRSELTATEAASAKEIALQTLKDDQDKLTESVGLSLTPIEAYNAKLREIAEAHGLNVTAAQSNALAAQAYGDTIDKQQQSLGLTLDPMAVFASRQRDIAVAQTQGIDTTNAQISSYAQLGGAALDLASTAVTAFGGMFKNNKAFAVAGAVINTAQAITKTLAEFGATPWGLAAAAVAAASGAAQIATIMSAQPGSSAKPSASGGAVSKTAADTATKSSRGGGGTRQAVTIQLLGEGGFSREQVRSLAEQLNGLVADGATIRMA